VIIRNADTNGRVVIDAVQWLKKRKKVSSLPPHG